MKIRLTFDLDDRDRQALALAFKTRRPATRTQVVQWLTKTVTASKMELLRDLHRHELNPDPHQQKLPGMDEDGLCAATH